MAIWAGHRLNKAGFNLPFQQAIRFLAHRGARIRRPVSAAYHTLVAVVIVVWVYVFDGHIVHHSQQGYFLPRSSTVSTQFAGSEFSWSPSTGSALQEHPLGTQSLHATSSPGIYIHIAGLPHGHFISAPGASARPRFSPKPGCFASAFHLLSAGRPLWSKT